MSAIGEPRRRGIVARVSNWYAKRKYGGGKSMAPLDVMAHQPRLLMGYGAFESAIKSGKSVDSRLKALGEMKAAGMVGCEWCMDYGSWVVLKESGVTERQLQELPRYRESDAFDDLEKLVLDFATAMSRTPIEVDDELRARLREHFDDAQLVELTTSIAIEHFRARFNHSLGLEPQGWSEGGVCVVAERPEVAASRGQAHQEEAGVAG